MKIEGFWIAWPVFAKFWRSKHERQAEYPGC